MAKTGGKTFFYVDADRQLVNSKGVVGSDGYLDGVIYHSLDELQAEYVDGSRYIDENDVDYVLELEVKRVLRARAKGVEFEEVK